MTEDTTFGFNDEALATRPTVYQPGLFDGQVVMVSGAGSGIGKAIAFLYARLGAKLVICGRDPAKLESCAEWLRRLGSPDVLVHPMTIRDPEQVEQLIDVAWLHFGRIDVLVNNAGGQFPQRALDYSVKGWKAVIDTNLNGTWYMMHAMARRWQGTGTRGNIVNIVATFQRGMPGVAHTCAARAAVTHLSKTVAVEWAQHGIRVNCIAPGAIASTGFRQYSPEAVKAFAGANPMKHVGDVQDVAEAAIYLSAPSGKFITGELLTVDGGGVLWGEVWTIAKPDYFKVNT